MRIDKIEVKTIQNSRGEDTIEIELFLDSGESGIASVPQGASTGEREAVSLPAEDAVSKINGIIIPALLEKDFETQDEFDDFLVELDGTEDKSRLGGNSLLSLSLAFARANAKEQNKDLYQYIADIAHTTPSLPRFYMNLVNGGKHGTNNLAFQEYMVIASANSAQSQLDLGKKIFARLKEKASDLVSELRYGDEGGLNIDLENIEKPLQSLNEVIKEFNLQDNVNLALDVAASSFYKDGKYLVDGEELSAEQLTELYKNLTKKYSITSIEDPFEENQFQDYATLKKSLDALIVVGDDLTTTNETYIKKAIQSDAINGLIVKPNQIGTLTETLEAIKVAYENNVRCIISHRSGDTMDDFIADLAYGVGAYGLKAGAPEPKERMAKYNRIIAIDGR